MVWIASQQPFHLADDGAAGQADPASTGDAVEFAAVVVEQLSPEPSTVKAAARAEIIVGPVTIRLEEGPSAARIAAIARVLIAET
ncbi:hypothetical protein [Agrobacterium sp. SORGH_AS 787]|uniref:hypothetical protein n=1 Tax=Agrobacterium sp. SORGH_AS 787 TaxID=3041775 RepID=UPI00278010FD|nr:hypothetical protein [Rhizobium sp. SORGH_AS_0787]